METRKYDEDLDVPLFSGQKRTHLPEALRLKMGQTLWASTKAANEECFSAYFNFVVREIEAWHASGCQVAIETYRDLLDLIQHLKATLNEKRSSPILLAFFPQIQDNPGEPDEKRRIGDKLVPVSRRYPVCTAESVHKALCFAVKLWLMIDVGTPSNLLSPGSSTGSWNLNESLKDILASYFPCDRPLIEPTLHRWPAFVDARQLDWVGGFDFVWTNNLIDHLKYDEDLGTIAIFHHTSVLEGNRASTQTNQAFPEELLDETLTTIALLLPGTKTKCKKWYKGKSKAQREMGLELDSNAISQRLGRGNRNIANMRFWNERMVLILQAFDAAQPRKVTQWMHDRRNQERFYGFWLAVLAVFLAILFGGIQCITGIIQAYAIYHPPKLSN